MVRQPVVAGRFYSASPKQCAEELAACIPDTSTVAIEPGAKLRGAVVPHAGWVCSGMVTGQTLATLATLTSPRCIVLLGAVHRMYDARAALYDEGAWATPLGQTEVDGELAKRLTDACPLITADRKAHSTEHSLEVQVPFIQKLFPEAKILPIMVPPSEAAVDVGRALGRVLSDDADAYVVVGSTDLTHYGPSYGIVSHGTGQEGLDWAKNENDRRMIERIEAMDPAGIVPEATRNHNACGPGAVAATIAACLELGATRALLVQHTTSAETLKQLSSRPASDAVGYAGFVFATPALQP